MTIKQKIDFEWLFEVLDENNWDVVFGELNGQDFAIVCEGANFEEKFKEKTNVDFLEVLKELNGNDDYGFNDQYMKCYHCDTIIDMIGYGKADYWINEYGDLACENCFDKEDYLEHITNNPETANELLSETYLSENNFVQLPNSYNFGWYGEMDKPKEIFGKLKENYDEVLFSINSINPFETNFSAWVKNEQEELTNE